MIIRTLACHYTRVAYHGGWSETGIRNVRVRIDAGPDGFMAIEDDTYVEDSDCPIGYGVTQNDAIEDLFSKL